MIILVAGASHTGKTAFAQKLLETYQYPYLSIDHLKMGLIRSHNTDLTPMSEDQALTDYLWPIVCEIIKTAIENEQNLIVEGCYIPFDWAKAFEEEYREHIRYICLIMSERYIREHFADIQKYASIIEERLDDEYCTPESVLRDNTHMLEQAKKYHANYLLIDDRYDVDVTLPLWGEAVFCCEEVLKPFVHGAREILRDNLVGVYLHGSAVMGCFNPAKSDIDLLVVVKEPLAAKTKRDFMELVVECNKLAPAKGIEMSILTRQACKPFVYPTPFELHFSVMHLGWYRDAPDDYVAKMQGKDKDLAAHVTILRRRGKCLYGFPVSEVFGDVPKEAYMDSIWNDIAEAGEDIAEDTMYLTLNLARVLAFWKEGIVLSKQEGGEWALQNLPEKFHPLLFDALREYREGAEISYDTGLAKAYAEYMLAQMDSERSE